MTLNDITIRDLLRKKLELELHLLKEVRRYTDAFEKDTGVPINVVNVIIDEIDTTPIGERKRFIYRMDVEVGFDLRVIE